jgi:hypothetical protein
MNEPINDDAFRIIVGELRPRRDGDDPSTVPVCFDFLLIGGETSSGQNLPCETSSPFPGGDEARPSIGGGENCDPGGLERP